MRNVRRVVLMMLTMVLLSSAAFAQSQATTGVIEGTVSDSSGAVLPGATVTLTNTGTNFTRELVTDADGRFRGLLLPLGTYRLTVSLTGFSNYQQDGIELVVGQTANIPVVLQVGGVAENITVTSDSPVVETTRSEASTLINQQALRGLPNNGRNFLSFMQLTPGRDDSAGPRRRRDQRQRPEGHHQQHLRGRRRLQQPVLRRAARRSAPGVHVQPGRHQGNGRRRRRRRPRVRPQRIGLRERRDEVGHEHDGRLRALLLQARRPVHEELRRREVPVRPGAVRRDASAGRSGRTSCSISSPTTSSSSIRRSSSIRTASRPRVVDLFASLGSPDENGSIDRTNDARVLLGKVDAQLTPKNLLTVRYNYTWSEQQNGTFDVDSWGRSANAVERDFSNAVSGSLATTLSSTMLHEFRFQFAREDRPRPYDGPDISGQSRPFPDTAFDFRQRLPVRRAVLHSRRLLRHARAVRRQPVVDQGPAHDQGRLRVQSGQLRANVRRLRQRPLHLQQHRRLLQLPAVRPEIRRVLGRHHAASPARAQPGRASLARLTTLPAAGGRWRPERRGSGHTVDPADRAGAVHSGQVAADDQPDDLVRHPLGGAAPARHDHAARSVVLSRVPRRSAIPIGRHDSVG